MTKPKQVIGSDAGNLGFADPERNDSLSGLSCAEAQQLILNLVLNARDSMPDGGTVSLETRLHAGAESRDPALEFIVSDSGTGMDAETAARIFDLFYTTKVPGRGTGTGLATVKRIVEAASGTISTATTPGAGTRMTVRLPQVNLQVKEEAEAESGLPKDSVRRRPQQSENRGAEV